VAFNFCSLTVKCFKAGAHNHWRRLVKNIGGPHWANQNIGGTKGGKK